MSIETSATVHEGLLRLGVFVVVLAGLLLWEALAPRRALRWPRRRRWPANFGVLVLNTILLRLAFPAAAAGVALFAQAEGWGLLNRVDLPAWAAVLIAVVALDLTIYLQHVLFHAVPALWRLHRMHHADQDFDVSTGGRFHPLEIVISLGIKTLAILSLGAPFAAVVIFEVLLSSTSLFNHSNVRMPATLDRLLRWLVVTPDMHRVHHSVETDEANSNFGFNLPWWDRLLGTYTDQPRASHERMDIGVGALRDPVVCQSLRGMLLSPFHRGTGDYSINRRWGGGGDR